MNAEVNSMLNQILLVEGCVRAVGSLRGKDWGSERGLRGEVVPFLPPFPTEAVGADILIFPLVLSGLRRLSGNCNYNQACGKQGPQA